MTEGVKLYHQFKGLVNKAGNIKLAWFTTFNLSISFFEKYVLSAIVKTNSQNLRSLKDFEALNDRIVNAEQGSIDIRVFHDYRAMRPDVKKTSIQTFAINPALIDLKFSNGVFHPKVGLLVNENNEAWLIIGSANLSISGWSGNSESIVVRKIEDKINAQKITSFFQTILPQSSDKSILENLNLIWQKELDEKIDNWKFFDSFSNQSLLTQLDLESTNQLDIWSPYFSDDLLGIIDKQLSPINQINIIPDRTNGNSIRMSDEVLDDVKMHTRINFLKDIHDYGNSDLLVHAKVWLADSKLAIGSWNFTKAGLNLSPVASNIEAGIIINLSEKEHDSFLESCNLKPLDSPEGMTIESLDEDRKSLLFDWKLTCQVYADWSTYSYQLETEKDLENQNYYIDLPGKKERIDLKQLRDFGSSFYNEYKSLLKDRLFTIFDSAKKGKKVFMGAIIELHPKERPAVGFDSINDLLRAWADKQPETKTQYHEVNYEIDTETGEELSDQIIEALKGDYSNAWFTMFLAFEQMKLRIKEASEKQDWRELKMIGYNIPGSVSQLSEHLSKLKEKVESKKVELSESFVWFIINEGNLVIQLFNKSKGEKDVPEIEMVENVNLDFKEVDHKQMLKWLDYIKTTCNYANV